MVIHSHNLRLHINYGKNEKHTLASFVFIVFIMSDRDLVFFFTFTTFMYDVTVIDREVAHSAFVFAFCTHQTTRQ